MTSLTCVIFRDSQLETDKCTVFHWVHCSQDMASVNEWHISVKIPVMGKRLYILPCTIFIVQVTNNEFENNVEVGVA